MKIGIIVKLYDKKKWHSWTKTWSLRPESCYSHNGIQWNQEPPSDHEGVTWRYISSKNKGNHLHKWWAQSSMN